jgi:hypothetical protein
LSPKGCGVRTAAWLLIILHRLTKLLKKKLLLGPAFPSYPQVSQINEVQKLLRAGTPYCVTAKDLLKTFL